MLVSGYWYSGSGVSPFYWNGNNGPSNANINIGARAVILWESTERACTTLPKGKTDCTQFKKEVFITVAQFRLRRVISNHDKRNAA